MTNDRNEALHREPSPIIAVAAVPPPEADRVQTPPTHPKPFGIQFVGSDAGK